jgi:hypothetical protein
MLLEMAQSWLKLAEQTAEGVATEVGMRPQCRIRLKVVRANPAKSPS